MHFGITSADVDLMPMKCFENGVNEIINQRPLEEKWQFRDLRLLPIDAGNNVFFKSDGVKITASLEEDQEGVQVMKLREQFFYGVISLHGAVEQARLLVPEQSSPRKVPPPCKLPKPVSTNSHHAKDIRCLVSLLHISYFQICD